MTPATCLILFVLTILAGCSKKERTDLGFKSKHFDHCKKSDELLANLTSHTLADLTFSLPYNWKVRKNEKLRGIEGLDTLTAKRESKIRTFTVYQFDSKGSDLLEYCKSEIKLMEDKSMKILESGTNTIGGIKSYYIINEDTVGNRQ